MPTNDAWIGADQATAAEVWQRAQEQPNELATTAYSYSNIGVTKTPAAAASSYTYSNTGLVIAGTGDGSSYDYHFTPAGVPSPVGTAYSYGNSGLLLAGSPSDGTAYSYQAIGLAPLTLSKQESSYSYGNGGFALVESQLHVYYQYENVGYYLPDLDNSAVFWQYENVGFKIPQEIEWLGWGVPITSDQTEHDSWFWVYLNVSG